MKKNTLLNFMFIINILLSWYLSFCELYLVYKHVLLYIYVFYQKNKWDENIFSLEY